jgi:pyruvate ferredoxin oxidoreductase gamma subunit
LKDKLLEIRFHGRGGQGVKTAALLLAEAAFEQGKEVQGFADYGPERAGAPVAGFTRISDEKITIHSFINNPDIVVIIDGTLVDTIPVLDGLTNDGPVIVNTTLTPQEIAKKLGKKTNIHTVDATGISLAIFGRDFPNAPILGAISKVTGIVPLSAIEDVFKKKFAGKDNLVKGNVEAVKKAYEEVKSI